jgi:hypothetical protein
MGDVLLQIFISGMVVGTLIGMGIGAIGAAYFVRRDSCEDR